MSERDSYRCACAHGFRLCYIVTELCLHAQLLMLHVSSLCSGGALPPPHYKMTSSKFREGQRKWKNTQRIELCE